MYLTQGTSTYRIPLASSTAFSLIISCVGRGLYSFGIEFCCFCCALLNFAFCLRVCSVRVGCPGAEGSETAETTAAPSGTDCS